MNIENIRSLCAVIDTKILKCVFLSLLFTPYMNMAALHYMDTSKGGTCSDQISAVKAGNLIELKRLTDIQKANGYFNKDSIEQLRDGTKFRDDRRIMDLALEGGHYAIVKYLIDDIGLSPNAMTYYVADCFPNESCMYGALYEFETHDDKKEDRRRIIEFFLSRGGDPASHSITGNNRSEGCSKALNIVKNYQLRLSIWRYSKIGIGIIFFSSLVCLTLYGVKKYVALRKKDQLGLRN